jgi:glyoxylase-like metal-dependent hydrolase (beta-lactamase superfamily II)
MMKHALIALTLAALTSSTNVLAAAEPVKTQAPGFYRMMLGQTEVTVLNDGTVDLPVDQLLQQDAEKTLAKLKRYHLTAPLETSVNAYLINTGDKLVLIDAGAGSLFGPTLGNIADNLALAGYKPEQVDEIYISHMHADHVGGLTKEGKRVYPNAVVRADAAEAAYWLSEAEMAKAPEDKKGFFQGAMASLKPYQTAGKLKTFSGKTELVHGIVAQPTHGHTPGHISYLVQSGDQRLLLLGDIIHVGAVQFDQPTVSIDFDSDANAAKAQRLELFKQAAESGLLVGATHLQFPSLGFINAQSESFRWIPLNYQRIK